MVSRHLSRHLSQAQRRAWVALLLDTADELGLPDDPEFRSAIVGYLEWGSRLAVINSASDENAIAPGTPMPKWGWGEVKARTRADSARRRRRAEAPAAQSDDSGVELDAGVVDACCGSRPRLPSLAPRDVERDAGDADDAAGGVARGARDALVPGHAAVRADAAVLEIPPLRRRRAPRRIR
jgi:hypothetical protein